jgi:hypothetical protein
MKVIFVLAILSFSSCAHTNTQPTAQTQSPTSPQPEAAQETSLTPKRVKVSCKNGSDVRTLEIVKKGTGCSLQYGKFGKVSSVASAADGQTHCEDSQDKITTKLEKSGFTCE